MVSGAGESSSFGKLSGVGSPSVGVPAILLPGGVMPAELAYGALLERLGDGVDAVAKELEIYSGPRRHRATRFRARSMGCCVPPRPPGSIVSIWWAIRVGARRALRSRQRIRSGC